MKYCLLAIISITIISCASDEFIENQKIIATDLELFYEALDTVLAVSDSAQQIDLIKSSFYDIASPGQQKMFNVRNYQAEEYRRTMLNNASYFKSLKPKALSVNQYTHLSLIHI